MQYNRDMNTEHQLDYSYMWDAMYYDQKSQSKLSSFTEIFFLTFPVTISSSFSLYLDLTELHNSRSIILVKIYISLHNIHLKNHDVNCKSKICFSEKYQGCWLEMKWEEQHDISKGDFRQKGQTQCFHQVMTPIGGGGGRTSEEKLSWNGEGGEWQLLQLNYSATMEAAWTEARSQEHVTRCSDSGKGSVSRDISLSIEENPLINRSEPWTQMYDWGRRAEDSVTTQ